MVAGALNLDGFSVEEEPLVSIEDSCAHAKGHALCVARLPTGFDRDNGRVEGGCIDRPEGRVGQLCCRGEGHCAIDGD
jgi:hypothetical protein